MNMADVNVSTFNEYRFREIHEKEPQTRLNEVISDLKEGLDIEGAVLVNESDEIIASAFSKNTNYKSQLNEIIAMFEELNDPKSVTSQDAFFSQRILDYHGFKILAKKLKDKLTLLVILKKRGYLSLAMLEIENTTRKIHEILLGYRMQKTPN
jgi:predicted regulator of Ras-like GTPase activity (Roadblock/LC7/MglB family)